MPVATPEQYADMLDRAKAGGFAYPAINVSSSQSINAVLQGLTEAGSDGIVQVTTGGADYFAGQTVKARATGALAFAEVRPPRSPRTTRSRSRCTPTTARRTRSPDFVLPLIEASEEEVKAGPQPDLPVAHVGRLGRAARREHRDRQGAAPPPQEHQRDPRGRDRRRRRRRGRRQARGLERGAVHDRRRRRRRPSRPSASARTGRYIAALTFGNVHGVYKPGNVKLTPRTARRDPGRHRGPLRHRPEAPRPRLPRRQRLDRRGDRPRGRRTAS